jgi:hypothetical protein
LKAFRCFTGQHLTAERLNHLHQTRIKSELEELQVKTVQWGFTHHSLLVNVEKDLCLIAGFFGLLKISVDTKKEVVTNRI